MLLMPHAKNQYAASFQFPQAAKATEVARHSTLMTAMTNLASLCIILYRGHHLPQFVSVLHGVGLLVHSPVNDDELSLE